MRIYFDTSALAKRYVMESGTEKVNNLFIKADQVVVSVITFPELISALSRNTKEKKISRAQYAERKAEAVRDFKDMGICDLTPNVIGSTLRFIEEFSLRTLDAIHLACAHETRTELFVTSDKKQSKTAQLLHMKELLI